MMTYLIYLKMILNFKPEHVPPILAGTKIHSMREDQHNRWKAGMGIQFYTGARTKNMKKLREDGICLGLQKVHLYQGSVGIMVVIDGRCLDADEVLVLACNDGFKNTEPWMRFFIPEIPSSISDMNRWHGRIIHWTDKKY